MYKESDEKIGQSKLFVHCFALFFFALFDASVFYCPPPKNNHGIFITLNPVLGYLSPPDTICHYVPEKIGQTNGVLILLVNSSTCPD